MPTETVDVLEAEEFVTMEDGRKVTAKTRDSILDREAEYFANHSSRYRPVRAKDGASASAIILRDRERF